MLVSHGATRSAYESRVTTVYPIERRQRVSERHRIRLQGQFAEPYGDFFACDAVNHETDRKEARDRAWTDMQRGVVALARDSAAGCRRVSRPGAR
jgi:hypothetical protein